MGPERRRSRLDLLFGTDELVPPLRTLRAGALTAELDGSSIRYVRWHGFEILRGIAFLLRDATWGTHAPEVYDLIVEESGDAFAVSYRATLDSADGDFRYRASIVGNARGELDYSVTGISTRGFTTSRTGFVVLHPLDGVVGRPLDIRHASGGASRTEFPSLVDPASPATDIASLAYAPSDGASLTVEFEGDAFEMEDHRNWTDASFKSYVRPLSRGYPYRIEPNLPVVQSVRMKYRPAAAAAVPAVAVSTVSIGVAQGRLPSIGLFADPASSSGNPLGVVALQPSFLLGRVDLRAGDAGGQLQGLLGQAQHLRCPLDLEVVIPGIDPQTELAPLRAALSAASVPPASLVVFPERDLKSRPADTVPPGQASPDAILAAARTLTPADILVGGGMPCGFPELNRNRPPAGIDFLTHATQATFHGADDVAVMETLETLPHIVRSARAFAGDVPYRLASATIGLPRLWCSGQPAANPRGTRVAMAEQDPRQRGLFAAAFAIGYLAQAAALGIDNVVLAATSGPFAATDEASNWYPLAAAIASTTRYADAMRLDVEAPAGVAALAAQGTDPVLWLANLGDTPRGIALGDESVFSSLWLMDAYTLARQGPQDIETKPYDGAPFTLDAYAVCRLT